jgi:hypothetical protein
MIENGRPDWLTPETRAFIRREINKYMARAFGEELARVSRLPLEERRAYIDEMIDYAYRQGVSFEKPAEGVTR